MSLYLLRRIYLSNPVVSRPRQLPCETQHSLRLSIYYWIKFSHVSVHYHVVLFSMFLLSVTSIPTDVLDYLSFHPVPSHENRYPGSPTDWRRSCNHKKILWNIPEKYSLFQGSCISASTEKYCTRVLCRTSSLHRMPA
jgi:hypothetical protein